MIKMIKMPNRNKALIISAVIHCVLFISIGFFWWEIVVPPKDELIELTLVDSSQIQGSGNGALKQEEQRKASANKSELKLTKQNKKYSATEAVSKEKQQTEIVEDYLDNNGEGVSSGSNFNGVGDGGGISGDGEGNGNGSGNGEGEGNGSGDGSGEEKVGPVLLGNPKPQYPYLAKQNGVEGTVYLQVRVLENGTVDNPTVVQSSGYSSLDKAAVKSIVKWRFTPAKNLKTGKAFACKVKVEVAFNINN